MIVNHASFHLNWNIHQQHILENATKLVIGSFNPFIPNINGNNAPFFYGRNSNYFWKSIAINLGFENDYYFDLNEGALRRLNCMDEYGFYFLDIISSIEIIGINELHEAHFVQEKIYQNFSDSVLFTTNTDFNGHNITINKTYNEDLNLLLQENNFQTIIHTLGNKRINEDFVTTPVGGGFQHFINGLFPLQNNFVPVSFSPSQLSVNRQGGINGPYFMGLCNWLNITLLAV